MKVFCKGRGKGKTTALVMTSAVTGARIIVSNESQKKIIKEIADKLNIDIPEPLTWIEQKQFRAFYKDGILIDNLEMMLPTILDEFFGCSVIGATMTVKEDIETKVH